MIYRWVRAVPVAGNARTRRLPGASPPLPPAPETVPTSTRTATAPPDASRSPIIAAASCPSTAIAEMIREAGGVDSGLDLDLLAAADTRIQGLPELRNTESLVVVHGGEVVFSATTAVVRRTTWRTRTR